MMAQQLLRRVGLLVLWPSTRLRRREQPALEYPGRDQPHQQRTSEKHAFGHTNDSVEPHYTAMGVGL
jgi:hypothetical protein